MTCYAYVRVSTDKQGRSGLGLEAPVVGFEIDLDALSVAGRREDRFVAPSRFPASMIDLAFALDAGVSARTSRAALGSASRRRSKLCGSGTRPAAATTAQAPSRSSEK